MNAQRKRARSRLTDLLPSARWELALVSDSCAVEPIDDIPATRRCYGGTWVLLAERSCTLTPDAHPSAGSFVRTIPNCQSLPRSSEIHPPRSCGPDFP